MSLKYFFLLQTRHFCFVVLNGKPSQQNWLNSQHLSVLQMMQNHLLHTSRGIFVKLDCVYVHIKKLSFVTDVLYSRLQK